MPGKENWRRRVAAMVLILMSLVSLSSPAQAAPAGSGAAHGKYAVHDPATALDKPVLVEAGEFATAVDLSTGAAMQAAEGVEQAHYNLECAPADHALLARSLGENVEQNDLLVNDVATERMPSTRRVDAQVTDPTAASGADYGIVRGPPGTHRCRG